MNGGDYQTVTGPDGKPYQFPKHATPQGIQTYFQKKGIVARQAPPSAPPSAPPPSMPTAGFGTAPPGSGVMGGTPGSQVQSSVMEDVARFGANVGVGGLVKEPIREISNLASAVTPSKPAQPGPFTGLGNLMRSAVGAGQRIGAPSGDELQRAGQSTGAELFQVGKYVPLMFTGEGEAAALGRAATMIPKGEEALGVAENAMPWLKSVGKFIGIKDRAAASKALVQGLYSGVGSKAEGGDFSAGVRNYIYLHGAMRAIGAMSDPVLAKLYGVKDVAGTSSSEWMTKLSGMTPEKYAASADAALASTRLKIGAQLDRISNLPSKLTRYKGEISLYSEVDRLEQRLKKLPDDQKPAMQALIDKVAGFAKAHSPAEQASILTEAQQAESEASKLYAKAKKMEKTMPAVAQVHQERAVEKEVEAINLRQSIKNETMSVKANKLYHFGDSLRDMTRLDALSTDMSPAEREAKALFYKSRSMLSRAAPGTRDLLQDELALMDVKAAAKEAIANKTASRASIGLTGKREYLRAGAEYLGRQARTISTGALKAPQSRVGRGVILGLGNQLSGPDQPDDQLQQAARPQLFDLEQ